jgi:hypothetical protein
VTTSFDAAEQFVAVRFGRVVLHFRDDIRNSPSRPNKLVIEGVKVDLCITFNQHTLFEQRGPASSPTTTVKSQSLLACWSFEANQCHDRDLEHFATEL